MSCDIIGDIRTECGKLDALVRILGYREVAGAWRHPERQPVFVGYFIDRAPALVPLASLAGRGQEVMFGSALPYVPMEEVHR